jgi:hypothetical protein
MIFWLLFRPRPVPSAANSNCLTMSVRTVEPIKVGPSSKWKILPDPLSRIEAGQRLEFKSKNAGRNDW